jgi:hypothetical protein
MSLTRCRLITVAIFLTVSSTSVMAENLTPDLQLNGYATAGMAWLTNSKGAQYLTSSASGTPGIQQAPTSEYDSVAGLQFKYRLNDQTDLVTQFVAAGSGSNSQQTNYSVKTNWAYIAYHANDDFTFRAGRFAFPTYLFSENLHVGEAYPWARLPVEIYSTLGSLYSMNGVEMLYRHSFGNWNLTLQPSVGEEQLNYLSVNNLRGITANISNDNLTLHLGTMQAGVNVNLNGSSILQNIEAGTDQGLAAAGNGAAVIAQVNTQIAAGLNVQHDRGSYSDAGALYDDGIWFGAAEYAQLRFAGWPQDFNSGYASIGHYVGKWLPYALLSRIKTVNSDELASFDFSGVALSPSTPGPAIAGGLSSNLAAGNSQEQETVSLGARYQLKSNVSLKMQVDRISDFHGSPGLFVASPLTQTMPTLGVVYLYSLSLNAAF